MIGVMSVKDREQSREALVRHDPAQKLYGIALFGEAGERPDNDDPELSVLDHPIPDELAEEARQGSGTGSCRGRSVSSHPRGVRVSRVFRRRPRGRLIQLSQLEPAWRAQLRCPVAIGS
jgi:hypothetical protein